MLTLSTPLYRGRPIDVVTRLVSGKAGIANEVAQAWWDNVGCQELEGRYFFSRAPFLFPADRPMTGG